MPLRHPQFRRGLLLRDELLLCFLQHNQPVPIPLGHLQNSLFFQLPSVTLSTGHFYLAQIGHSHVAPTVLDFGLAKLQLGDREYSVPAGGTTLTIRSDLTIAGSVIGTVSYMSPEQIRGE